MPELTGIDIREQVRESYAGHARLAADTPERVARGGQ